MSELENVQVGDDVIMRICGGAGQEIVNRTKIIKVTKTQITVKDGTRFLKNGLKVGEGKKKRGWFTFLYTEKEYLGLTRRLVTNEHN